MFSGCRFSSRSGLAVFFLCVGLVTACGGPSRPVPTPTPWPTPIVSEKPTYAVQRGTVVDWFVLAGQVVPAQWEPLYFTVDGRLASLRVAEGSEVKKGDILAELEMKALSEQLAQAQLALEQAPDQLAQQQATQRFALERARLNLRLQELALESIQRLAYESAPAQRVQAEKELERARLKLQQAQSEYDKVAWRSDVGATPQAAALQQATVEYQIAEARYKQQVAGDTDIQIAKQEIQVKLAELALQEVEARHDPSLQRNLDKAKIQVQALERQMEERRLRAPFDGKVLAIGLNVQGPLRSLATQPKVGDNIPGYTPLIVLAKPERVEIAVTGSGGRTDELVVGQPVTITHVLTDRPFSGRVAALPVRTLNTGAQPTMLPVVRIALGPDAPPVSIGDGVGIEVVMKVRENTLFLPPPAVRHFMGRAFVVRQESGKQRRVDITTGLENDRQVEILSGLQEGDTVVGQ